MVVPLVPMLMRMPMRVGTPAGVGRHAALRVPVDAYFDGVMVNAEALDVRLNRLGTLKSLHDAMNRVADLARIAS